MQRVRIGLTGLGFVFVVVLLATALTGAPDAEVPATPNGMVSADGNRSSPQEPLAELGVTPGNADSKAAHANTNQAARQFR